MKIKNWLLYAFVTTCTSVIVVFFLMIWSDTYSNIHTDRTEFYTEPNKNVKKVEYILENKMKYDSFIFGSSRVGSINPLKIDNGNYYNMTYSEGIPHEHLINIQLFIDSGIKIKNLLIGLDEFSYQVSFIKHQNQGLTKAHYLATKTDFIIYCRELYLRFPLGEDRHHIKKKLFGADSFKLNVSSQSTAYKKAQESFSRVKYETPEHLNNPTFNKPTFYSGNTLNDTIKDIQAIKNICTNNKINCIFFINPIHKKTYEFSNLKLLKTFRYNLSQITPYYDFSYPNKISEDNSYWIETSHYTLEVGGMILDKIHKNKTNNNFGKYIKGSR
ncbi:MAG: hypothetical protein U9N33_12015 [Campylobacterota bacterium]|nr:hypothetical protein [Campylobacterota bacterium]